MSAEELSKSQAAGDFLCFPDDMSISFAEAYEITQDEDFFNIAEDKGIVVYAPYENEGESELSSLIDDHKRSIERTLKDYAENIKRGMIIMSFHDKLDLDVNQIDIDLLATIGLNTSKSPRIDGQKAEFDLARCEWTAGQNSFEINLKDGMPGALINPAPSL